MTVKPAPDGMSDWPGFHQITIETPSTIGGRLIHFHQVESQSPSDEPPADRRARLRKAAKAAAGLARAGGPVDHIRADRSGSEDRQDDSD